MVFLQLPGCSIRHLATGSLADALSSQGSGFATDDDPDLIRDAAPFGLKTMEQVLDDQPKHVGLLTSLASGFTQYAVAFVQADADELADKDRVRSQLLQIRARKLFLRARNYGLRGLEVRHPGFTQAIENGDPAASAAREKQLASLAKEDVALLYWTGAAWTLAIASGKDQMKLVGDLPLVESMMARAYAIDPDYDQGALEEYFVAYDASRSAAEGGGPDKARKHLDRALALSKNEKLGGLVSYAEGVCVNGQDKATFTQLLDRVVAFDADTAPAHRLANLVAQRRAKWLLGRAADLFAE